MQPRGVKHNASASHSGTPRARRSGLQTCLGSAYPRSSALHTLVMVRAVGVLCRDVAVIPTPRCTLFQTQNSPLLPVSADRKRTQAIATRRATNYGSCAELNKSRIDIIRYFWSSTDAQVYANPGVKIGFPRPAAAISNTNDDSRQQGRVILLLCPMAASSLQHTYICGKLGAVMHCRSVFQVLKTIKHTRHCPHRNSYNCWPADAICQCNSPTNQITTVPHL